MYGGGFKFNLYDTQNDTQTPIDVFAIVTLKINIY